MQMRPAIQLQSIMKSMKENILPAIDPNHKLAVEQVRLILDMLNIMSQRLELEYRYDRDELERLLNFAVRLQRQTQGGPVTNAVLTELEPVLVNGIDVFDRARAEPSELIQAVKSLRSILGEAIKAIFVDDAPDSRKAMRVYWQMLKSSCCASVHG